MTSNGQFDTAARRRGGRPVTLTVRHFIHPDEDALEADPAAEGREVEVLLLVDPNLDVIAFGAAFGQLADSMKMLSSDALSSEQKIELMETEAPKVRAALRQVLTNKSRGRWDEIADVVDLMTIAGMLHHIMKELGGMDPTLRPASSGGSGSTTPLSTDGHSSTGSIPPASPSPEP